MKLQTPRISPTVLIVPLMALSACTFTGDDVDSRAELPGDEEARSNSVAADDGDLVAAFDLPAGGLVQFMAHDDGSVTVTEEGDAWHDAVSSRPEFAEATAYDLFFALAAPDQEAPPELLAYHAAMVAAGEPTMDLSDKAQGWLSAKLASAPPPPISSNPCPDLVYDFACTAGSSYPDGPGCFYNLYGWAAWYDNDTPMRRYRTSFCTLGTVEAVITWTYAGPGDCLVFRPLHFLRNGLYSNHHYNYWWSGPSGTTPRSHDNRVEHVSGSGFSWGVKEKEHTSTSCKI